MSVGIFKTLFDLKLKSANQPLEDYLTEILAYCFESNPSLLQDFFMHFAIEVSSTDEYSVSTQYTLIKLEDHETDSRPDIAVFTKHSTVFFENKIGSGEGWLQLKRYAEHLDRSISKHKVLIYLTRDFDKKNGKEILKNCKSKIKFIQLRWFQLYQFLDKHNESLITKELISFMKQINLSMNNQFTPVDLLTLSNFSNVRKMLEEVMIGQVSDLFEQINGRKSKHSASLTQLRNHDRYIYWAEHNDGLSVMLGFWMNSTNEKQYPEVKVVIEVAPNSKKRELVTKELDRISKKHADWEGYDLNSPSTWAGVAAEKSLQDFLSEEDHIEKIKGFFMEKLDELKVIFKENENLPIRNTNNL
jgi:hypothetical protein